MITGDDMRSFRPVSEMDLQSLISKETRASHITGSQDALQKSLEATLSTSRATRLA